MQGYGSLLETFGGSSGSRIDTSPSASWWWIGTWHWINPDEFRSSDAPFLDREWSWKGSVDNVAALWLPESARILRWWTPHQFTQHSLVVNSLLNYNHYFNEIFLNIYLLKSLYIYKCFMFFGSIDAGKVPLSGFRTPATKVVGQATFYLRFSSDTARPLRRSSTLWPYRL